MTLAVLPLGCLQSHLSEKSHFDSPFIEYARCFHHDSGALSFKLILVSLAEFSNSFSDRSMTASPGRSSALEPQARGSKPLHEKLENPARDSVSLLLLVGDSKTFHQQLVQSATIERSEDIWETA